MQINLVDFLVVSLLFQHMHHKDETILPYEKAYAYKMFQYTHHEDATCHFAFAVRCLMRFNTRIMKMRLQNFA